MSALMVCPLALSVACEPLANVGHAPVAVGSVVGVVPPVPPVQVEPPLDASELPVDEVPEDPPVELEPPDPEPPAAELPDPELLPPDPLAPEPFCDPLEAPLDASLPRPPELCEPELVGGSEPLPPDPPPPPPPPPLKPPEDGDPPQPATSASPTIRSAKTLRMEFPMRRDLAQDAHQYAPPIMLASRARATPRT